MITFTKIRVKVIGNGKEDNPFRVDLPTYFMPKDKDVEWLKMEVEVMIPSDEVLLNGHLNQNKIREKYPLNWSNFNASGVEV
jgi:hypothetical protein